MEQRNEYTTLEQAKQLMEVGLDPKTADMYLAKKYDRHTGDNYWEANLGPSPAIRYNLFSFRNGYILPCWSFAALFRLLPVIDRDEPQLKLLNAVGRNEAGLYRICYNNQTDHPFLSYAERMTDAAVGIVYQMVKAGWIFESGTQKEEEDTL